MYRICSQPISSFGVICYRIAPAPEKGGNPVPQYLMVQRKDSLSFVEFIRGKYNVQNRGYIMRLLSNMTLFERSLLHAASFDALWHGFWQSEHSSGFVKEYEQSKARFSMLRAGYYLRPANAHQADVVFFSLETALTSTAAAATHTEPEYGFPKGRRNINESDLSCACREFSEEAGLDVADIELVHPSGGRPYEEVFMGSNHTRYRHVYYVARLRPDSCAWADAGNEARAVVDPVQSREVRAVAWFDAENVVSHLRPENVERRTLFLQVHQAVLAGLAAIGRAGAQLQHRTPPPPPPPPPKNNPGLHQ